MREFGTQLEIYSIVMFRFGTWRSLIKCFVINGCYFLVFVQESNQRKRLGGGVEAAVYRYHLNYPTLLPRLRATLPPDPLPGLVVGLAENKIKVTIVAINHRLQCHCEARRAVAISWYNAWYCIAFRQMVLGDSHGPRPSE